MKRTNLVLIGMPASGKSTVGVILAKLIGFDFMDTDLLIQRAEKRKLSQIIEAVGIDGFLEIENRINASVEADHCVIATGGSAVYGREAMEHFRKIGHIIYLKVEYPQLAHRLRNIRQRGVVLREGQTLRDLFDERTVLYEQYADTVIEEEGEVEDTVVQILKKMGKRDG